MSLLTVHPRFFTTITPADEQTVVVSEGDASIDTLYDIYVCRKVNTASWTFRSEVLRQALRLFGNFQEWLEYQRANPAISGYNRDFLEDTVRYIQTGQRQMLVLNWVELMDEIDYRERPVTTRVPLTLLSNANTVQVLQTWCSHTDGVEDLVQTLYVLFGHKHRPN